MTLGLEDDGELEVPPLERAGTAGWYRFSPVPGEIGPAVIVGHVDSQTGPAVFHRLGSLGPGDLVRVRRADGTSAEFTVDRVASFPKSDFPTDVVYGPIRHAGLRLITCSGTYLADRGGYQENTVVFASRRHAGVRRARSLTAVQAATTISTKTPPTGTEARHGAAGDLWLLGFAGIALMLIPRAAPRRTPLDVAVALIIHPSNKEAS